MNTNIDFIGGNTRRCFFAMALPMIAAMYLNMAYNLVDSIWSGNLFISLFYGCAQKLRKFYVSGGSHVGSHPAKCCP